MSKNGSDRGLFGLKKGPQEIGKIKYRGTKLSQKEMEELERGDLLSDTVHHDVKKRNRRQHRRAKSLLGSKPGPIEMGKNRYHGTTMDDDDEEEAQRDLFSKKTHIITKKKWHRKASDFDLDLDSDSEFDLDSADLSASRSGDDIENHHDHDDDDDDNDDDDEDDDDDNDDDD